jgi:hypothetical protein
MKRNERAKNSPGSGGPGERVATRVDLPRPERKERERRDCRRSGGEGGWGGSRSPGEAGRRRWSGSPRARCGAGRRRRPGGPPVREVVGFKKGECGRRKP